ncbi:MAG: substrate-binding domain-containing protein [bacterium]
MSREFRVMTSGAFTAAHLRLLPAVERITGLKVVTVTTSIGTGDISIPNRLKRGEVADLVICDDSVMQGFIRDGLARAEGRVLLAQSVIGVAVRAGAPAPDIGTVDTLCDTLLRAASIGYSASVSGRYVTNELLRRLGIHDEVMPKCQFVGNGQRVGTFIANGEIEIGFQQVSELLPIEGIAHITPLPDEVQLFTTFSAAVGVSAVHPEAAVRAIEFLASAEAADDIRATGLEPAAR